MKQRIFYISLLLSFWLYGTVYSQTSRTWILQQDLSCLFDSLSMIGVLGDDCRRIDIRFCEAQKTSDRDYRIEGMSRTRLSIICPFEGKVCIDSVTCQPQIKSECTDVDGFIYRHYSFTEHGDKRYSGVFLGSFKQAYRLNEEQVNKGENEISELKLNFSEYMGEWKSANGITKVCSWADEIVPGTPQDFCKFNDAAEWIVSPQYRKNGWDNLYNAYYNDKLTTNEIQKARAMEEQEWWTDKAQSK
ncbi:MAG: hypothetical protein LUE99_08325 [Bacteroides sp.]|nr:hypothetical protein [Bacteroides sp.]